MWVGTGTPWLLSVAYLQAYNMGLLLAPLQARAHCCTPHMLMMQVMLVRIALKQNSLVHQMCCEYSYNCIPAITTLHDPRNAATLAFGVVVCCGAYFCMRAHREAWVVRWRPHRVANSRTKQFLQYLGMIVRYGHV